MFWLLREREYAITRTLYPASIHDCSETAPSYWEASVAWPPDAHPAMQGACSCGVAEIGGDCSGLSAAFHLARNHSVDVRVLEADTIGWTSSRNGGLCTLAPTLLSIPHMIGRYGLHATRHFHETQLEAIELVDGFRHDESIDYDRQSDASPVVAHDAAGYRALRAEADQLKRVTGVCTHLYGLEEFRGIGHGGTAHRLDDDPSVWFSLGYHGNGVNTAPWAGRLLARRIAGTTGSTIPAPMAGLTRRFPFPALRLWMLRGACLYYRILDSR